MQWHQLDHMQTICTSLQTDNHTNTSSLNFYRPDALSDAQTDSVKALKALYITVYKFNLITTTIPTDLLRVESANAFVCLTGVFNCFCQTFSTWPLQSTQHQLLYSAKFLIAHHNLPPSLSYAIHTYTHTRLTALFQVYPGEPVPER